VPPTPLILKTRLRERADAQWSSGRLEVAFYTQIAAPMSATLLPRCFDAVWDNDTNNWHLLLEDLTNSHFTLAPWPMPPTLEQSERIIAVRARFHAGWWDDPRLGVSIGTLMEPPHDPPRRLFAEKFARFVDRVGDRLPAERRAIYERLIEEGHRLYARSHAHRNMTIIQGDAHVWNVFLPQAGGDGLRLFDWDSWRVDVATDDLAYMMALHWFPDHRRRYERHLLDHYHAELLAHGLTGYDRSSLDDDHCLSVLWQIATPVWQAWNNNPPRIWWPHLERIFMAVDDLGCRDLLSK
jgi:Ecdysteroid kinase-like family